MYQHPLCTNIPFPENTAPSADDYVSIFSCRNGGTLIFAASEGARDAWAYHSANDFEPFPVIGGVAQWLYHEHNEDAFIATCWETTRNLRHSFQDDYQATLTVCDEPRVLPYLLPVTKYNSCGNCFQSIGVDDDRRWFHVTEAGDLRERGCRAASRSVHGIYNESLSKRLTAKPRY